jgi:hypothetical protein
MTRKRSSYRPKGANPTAHLMAMQGASLLRPDDVQRFRLILVAAVDAISRGEAGKKQWGALFDAVNLVEAWVQAKVVQDPGNLNEVQETMVAAMERQRDRGTRALKHDELAILRGFTEDYCTVLGGVTHKELFDAEAAVRQRVARVMAEGAAPGVKVVEPCD